MIAALIIHVFMKLLYTLLYSYESELVVQLHTVQGMSSFNSQAIF